MNKLITLFILLTIGCSSQKQKKDTKNKIKTDLDNFDLKGDVKIKKIFRLEDTIKILSSEYKFNKQGFLISKDSYHDNGKLWINDKYYYRNKKVDKIICNLPEQNRIKTKQYSYNNNEIQIEHLEKGIRSILITEIFDKENNKIYSNFNRNNDSITTYSKYNNLNKLINEKKYSKNKELLQEVNFTYDSNDLLTKMEQTNFYGEKSSYRVNYFYDGSNNRIGLDVYMNNIFESKEKILYENKMITEHHFYDKEKSEKKVIYYKYDSKGNVTYKTTRDKRTQETTVYLSVVEYYN